MEQKNILRYLTKIVGGLLLVVVFVTILYGSYKFSINKEIGNSEVPEKKTTDKAGMTTIYKINEICESQDFCEKTIEVKFNKNKSDKISIFKNLELNTISINDKQIVVPNEGRILEFGVWKSKYYVIKYQSENDNFYYLDENLRDAKKVFNLIDEVSIDATQYKYYSCIESDSARGGVVKNTYSMEVLDNGTFVSSFVEREEGAC